MSILSNNSNALLNYFSDSSTVFGAVIGDLREFIRSRIGLVPDPVWRIRDHEVYGFGSPVFEELEGVPTVKLVELGLIEQDGDDHKNSLD